MTGDTEGSQATRGRPTTESVIDRFVQRLEPRLGQLDHLQTILGELVSLRKEMEELKKSNVELNQTVYNQNVKMINLERIIDENEIRIIKKERSEKNNKLIVIGMSEEVTEENAVRDICKLVKINPADLLSISKIGKPNAKKEQLRKITFNNKHLSQQHFFSCNNYKIKSIKFESDKSYNDRKMTKALLQHRYEIKADNPSIIGKINDNKLILSDGREYYYSFVHQQVKHA